MKKIIHQAMHDSDRWVVSIKYRDSKGKLTRRIVSPIRFLSADRFLALCLCREEPRQFLLSGCHSAQLVPAHEVLMPVCIA